jgi:two-component system, chemotaxis family, protein-glutamate methylesterase/glutaminase
MEETLRTDQRDIIVIGASAGGVETLAALVGGLPAELPAAVFVVLHLLPTAHSVLPDILDRAGPLPAGPAASGDEIERGRIYVAPPDHHLLLMPNGIQLTRGPRENGHRPAVDPLFRSAARAYRERVIGVVLSGALDDGTAGLRMVKRMGGATVAQDPGDAAYPSMPASAIANDSFDCVAAIAEMPDLLCRLVDASIEIPARSDADDGAYAVASPDRSDDEPTNGDLTGLTCPECGGALWEHSESGVIRFKCHVGHAYSLESLDVSQSQGLEMALWAALRSLQERADMFRRLARRSSPGTRFEEKARTADEHAATLRRLITTFGREPGEAGETG